MTNAEKELLDFAVKMNVHNGSERGKLDMLIRLLRIERKQGEKELDAVRAKVLAEMGDGQ